MAIFVKEERQANESLQTKVVEQPAVVETQVSLLVDKTQSKKAPEEDGE